MAYDTNEIERLRRELSDYYGTGAFAGMSAMLLEVSDIEDMTDEELIDKARREGLLPRGSFSG